MDRTSDQDEEQEQERLPLFHRDPNSDLNPETERLSCKGKVSKSVKKRLPIFQWLPKYQKKFILADLIAGVTVTLTAIPQSIAYAAIAGLTPEYGIYSHFVGPLLYIFLGSCRQVTVGPTAVVELLTFQTCGTNFPSCVILLGFYSGIIELLMGFLRLGFLINFISEPVTIGFTTGAVGTIASSQIKSLFGLSGKSSGKGFIASWKFIFSNFHTLRIGDTCLGLSSVLVLLVLQKLKDMTPPKNFGNPVHWKRAMHMIALGRNALVLIVTSLIAFIWIEPPFAITGKVQPGFPPIGPPSFTLIDPHSNSTEPMTFTETLGFLKAGPLSIAIMAILQNVAISKAFGIGQSIDATQEMVALGAINVVGGFFSCLPTSGSFTRSAIADASGVKSQLNGLFVGILIILSLNLLTSSFQYIPKSSLAGVIVVAVIFMVDHKTAISIYKTSKLDFCIGLATFLCSLFLGMEYGILVGVALSICLLLYRTLNSSLHPEFFIHSTTKLKYISVKPDHGGLNFPTVDSMREKINKLTSRYPSHSIVVIHCGKWTCWDFTSLSSMISLAKIMKSSGRPLVFFKTTKTWTDALKSHGSKAPLIICPNDEKLDEFFCNYKKTLYVKDGNGHNNSSSNSNSNWDDNETDTTVSSASASAVQDS